jgi:CelD/BcsL family acetyltransferase involved in cellulose biosynthesis
MGGRRDAGELTQPPAPPGAVAAAPVPAVASRTPRDLHPATTTKLRVEVVTALDQLAELADPWRRLVQVTPSATPFASPAFVLTWFRHLERPRGAYVVTVWRGDELVGLAPFARTRLGGEHTGFQMLVSAGTEHGDHGEPLLGLDPGPVAEVVAAHLAKLVRTRLAAVNARRLFDEGPMLAALVARDDLARVPMGHVAHAAVVRFDQLDDPYDHLERLARRHDIPRRMRRLCEDVGPIEYTPDEPRRDATLDAMASMLLHRWGTEAGPRLFATPGRAAFTRAVTHALARDGMGRLSTLSAGGRLAAVSTVLQVGDRVVSDNAAFDIGLGRYGVGQAEIYRLLHHALEAGVVEVDMRAGDFPYKRKWTNAERRTRSVVLVSPGRRGELSLAARRAALRVRTRRIRRGERHAKGAVR